MQQDTKKKCKAICKSTSKACTNHVSEDTDYCSQYHNELEMVRRWSAKYPNDLYMQAVSSSFLEYNKSNPLQPSGAVPSPGIEKKDLFNYMKVYTQRYLEWLLAMVDSGHVSDLKQRALKVVELLKSGGFKKLRLMDGHGRALALICQLLLSTDILNFLTIEIVDLDQKVIDYHKSVFGVCKSIKVLKKDICDFEISSDTLVYMNFCGISKSLDKAQTYLAKSADRGVPVVISFSCARLASKKDYAAKLRGKLQNKPMHLEKVDTGRKVFATFALVDKNGIKIEESNNNNVKTATIAGLPKRSAYASGKFYWHKCGCQGQWKHKSTCKDFPNRVFKVGEFTDA